MDKSLKQYCLNYLLLRRENIPKNVNTICEIPEIREEFVNLAKRKNLVDDQFFSVFGDIFIVNYNGYGSNALSSFTSSTLYNTTNNPTNNNCNTGNLLNNNGNNQHQQHQQQSLQQQCGGGGGGGGGGSSGSVVGMGQGGISANQASGTNSSAGGVHISQSGHQGCQQPLLQQPLLLLQQLNNNSCTTNSNANDTDIEMTTTNNTMIQVDGGGSMMNHATGIGGNGATIQEIDLSLLGRLTDISIQFITKYNHLQHLNLSFCTGLSSDFIKYLAAVPDIQLQSLNLYNTNTNDNTLHQIAATYSHTLRSLSIGNCQAVTETGIKSLAKLNLLTHLDVSHCRKLTSISTKLISFPHLQFLNASWIGSVEAKESTFSKCVRHCPQLTSLSIAASNVTETELTKILTEGKRLAHLDISYCVNAISSIDSKVFKYMTQLQSLTLAGCSFKEPVLRRIIESTPLLRELDLSHQEGVLPWSLLLGIINDPIILKHLQMLNLSQSKFDRFDIDTLLQFPQLVVYLPSL